MRKGSNPFSDVSAFMNMCDVVLTPLPPAFCVYMKFARADILSTLCWFMVPLCGSEHHCF
jgi:hypothetical protein